MPPSKSTQGLVNLLKPHGTKIMVYNSRRNALLKEVSKSEGIDARKPAEMLRSNLLPSVYHVSMEYGH